MNPNDLIPADDRKPSILGCLILTRMIANSKPPARGQIVKDLKPLVAIGLREPDKAWRDLVALTFKELFALSCVSDPVRKSEITDHGRAALRHFLKTDALPERKSWSVIKKSVLAPLALGHQPATSRDLDRIAKADGFHAALLRHLFDLRLTAFPSLPLAISALAAQKGLQPLKPTADSLRDAFLQSWITGISEDQVWSSRLSEGGVEQSNEAENRSLPGFANRVRSIALEIPGARETGKVLISQIWDRLKAAMGSGSLSRESFNEQLLLSNQARLLSLSRADLTVGLDEREIRDSEISPEFGDSFHFVRTDQD